MATPIETAIEALECASITFTIIAADRSNIARTCDGAKRSSDLIDVTVAALRLGEKQKVAPERHDALTEFFQAVDLFDGRMNDPKGNGTGDDARSPTGDDYNSLMEIISVLRGKVV
jgi:hypothetical protein